MSTYLEVNDDQNDQDGGQKIWKVGSILSVECILKCIKLVALGQKEMEECNDWSFEFSALLGSDGDGWEALPQDILADVCGEEEGNATAETVALLQ